MIAIAQDMTVRLMSEQAAEMLGVRRRTRPDAVLLDLRMPVMDGYEVLDTLNADETLRDIPVVVMTAYHVDENRAHLLDLATTCLAKPLDADSLVGQLENLLPGKADR